MNLEEMNDWEKNVILTSMEIAWMVLNGQMGEDVCEGVLEALDINNDEAGVLEQNLESILEEEGVVE